MELWLKDAHYIVENVCQTKYGARVRRFCPFGFKLNCESCLDCNYEYNIISHIVEIENVDSNDDDERFSKMVTIII